MEIQLLHEGQLEIVETCKVHGLWIGSPMRLLSNNYNLLVSKGGRGSNADGKHARAYIWPAVQH